MKTAAHAVVPCRFTCLQVVILVKGRAVLVAEFRLHLAAAGAERNVQATGKTIVRAGTQAMTVIVARLAHGVLSHASRKETASFVLAQIVSQVALKVQVVV